MAARRLLILMLVLLGISTLAAAFIPTPSRREDETETTVGEQTEASVGDALPQGVLRKPVRIDADLKRISVIRIGLGDQLPLTVSSKRADLVEIPALGQTETVAPGSPATLDILVDAPGSYGIRLIEADRVIGRIEVERPGDRKGGRGKPEAREDR